MDPYERAKPPRRTSVPVIVGCHVCGADPTWMHGTTPLCPNCDMVTPPVAAAFLVAFIPHDLLSVDPRILLTAVLFLVGFYALWHTTCADEADTPN